MRIQKELSPANSISLLQSPVVCTGITEPSVLLNRGERPGWMCVWQLFGTFDWVWLRIWAA